MPQYYITSKDMLGMPRKHSLSMGEELLKGNMVVDTWIKETVSFSLEVFDWNAPASDSPTTYQLFLQGLTPVAFLVGDYVLSGNSNAYELAKKITWSWFSFYPEDMPMIPQAPISYVWDQHSVALRTESLLYFLLVGHEHARLSSQEEETICARLQRHAQYLKSSKYYLENENHGVFEDRALLYYGYTFLDLESVETAVMRLKRQWSFLFTKSGVCVENSYTYQRVNKDLFVEISEILANHNNFWTKTLRDELLLAEDFMGHALLPDHTSPPVGDSQKDSYFAYKCLNCNSVLAYAVGNNTTNTPIKTRVLYLDAGYYIGREFWHSTQKYLQPSDSLWTMFRSGYQSITHRHADDNSFLLYARGHDVFVDSGAYNYMFRDPIRQYVRSANAHNTVVVDNTSYDFLRKDATKLSGFFSYRLDENNRCDYVAAYNLHRVGVTHIRHFFYYLTDLLIIDELSSHQSHQYSQLFHCGKNIKPEKVTAQETLLRISDTGYYMLLRQHLKCPTIEVFNGAETSVRYGNISEQFNEIIPTNTLKFDLHGTTVTYITQLSLLGADRTSSSGLNFAIDISSRTVNAYSKDGGLYQKSEYAVFGPQYRAAIFRFPMVDFDFSCSGPLLIITNLNSYRDDVQYAWYILEDDERTICKQTEYSESPEFRINAESDGLLIEKEYIIRAFVYCKYSKKKAAQSICKVLYDGKEFHIQPNMNYDACFTDWLA